MDDLRWFAPNRYCTLPVPALRHLGLEIALEGDAPAGAAIASDGSCAVDAFKFARRYRCPLVTYLWDLPPWRLGAGKPDPIFEIGARLLRVRRPWGGYSERSGYYSRIRYIARNAEAVWCPSTSTVQDVRRHFGVEAKRIPFCFDSERFRAGIGDRGSGVGGITTVLSISRLVPHKNHAVILRAAARLEPRPHVRILGQGGEAANLRRLARELGVALDLPGVRVSDNDVLVAYRAASVLVCPSEFEGFGLTPMEGIAMGVPVIASDIPTHREFLDGAVRYFPPHDDTTLAAEIGAATSQPSSRPAVRSPVLADLTIEASAARLLPELSRIVARAP